MTSSMLGCVAAVMETESPSQPNPAVIHKIWSSATAGFLCVTRPYGIACAVIIGDLLLGVLARLALFNCSEKRSEPRKDATPPYELGNADANELEGANIARAMSRSLARILVTADYRFGADLFGTVFESCGWVSRLPRQLLSCIRNGGSSSREDRGIAFIKRNDPNRM